MSLKTCATLGTIRGRDPKRQQALAKAVQGCSSNGTADAAGFGAEPRGRFGWGRAKRDGFQGHKPEPEEGNYFI